MAKKASIKYVCQSCGALHGSWMGKCNSCNEWNTIVEQLDDYAITNPVGNVLTTSLVKNFTENKSDKRISTGIKSVDDVLGGGVVADSIILIAGQPGIGKSTILTQISRNVSDNYNVLYVSGEESINQISMRSKRLGAGNNSLYLSSSNSANDIAKTVATQEYDLIIVDSIQTVSVDSVSSSAGTVSQISNSTQVLMAAAKSSNTAMIIVGHVTKEGSIAGPKVLEHIVDVVLQLEGDRYGGFKILRGIKNRFGNTNESAIFEMKESGLEIVDNPSAALLEERQVSDGSIVLATMEGARPILVEVQALVNTSSYGYPKRTASGLDINRVNLLIAVLEKRTKLKLSDKDIYVNIVGGLKISEPAADLAICMAIASAAKGMQLAMDAVVFGELGLSGEVRRVNYIEKRIQESKKLGFSNLIIPHIKDSKLLKIKGLNQVSDIKTALNKFLSTSN